MDMQSPEEHSNRKYNFALSELSFIVIVRSGRHDFQQAERASLQFRPIVIGCWYHARGNNGRNPAKECC